jgi:sarcosine oxidase, subunit delta
MQLIACPWCGSREESEFRPGGQAHISYPPDPGAMRAEEWGQ